jgi:hypothetical protein
MKLSGYSGSDVKTHRHGKMQNHSMTNNGAPDNGQLERSDLIYTLSNPRRARPVCFIPNMDVSLEVVLNGHSTIHILDHRSILTVVSHHVSTGA